MRRHPFALSFYSWAAEFELARQLAAQGVQLLGIDQVSSFTPGRFYQKLAALATHPATKKYLLRRAAAYQAHDRAVMRPEPGQKTMYQQPAAARRPGQPHGAGPRRKPRRAAHGARLRGQRAHLPKPRKP